MLANRYILLVLFSLFFGSMAYAYGTLSSEPISVRPEMHMNSTSVLLNPKTVVTPSGYNAVVVQRPSASVQMMKFSPLHATSAKRKTVQTAQFGIAYDGVQLPAVFISNRNWDDIIFSNSSSSGIVSPPGPRRVNEEGDDPANPYIDGNHTPVGDVPMVWMLLLLVAFISWRTYTRKQNS